MNDLSKHDAESLAYLAGAYGTPEQFQGRARAVLAILQAGGEAACEGSELTSDLTREGIKKWAQRQADKAAAALAIYDAAGAKGPGDPVWSDLDCFANVWEECLKY